MWETVSLDWQDKIALLTVDRPDAHNALNVQTLEALLDALAQADQEDAAVLVLQGAGEDAFIAGADIAQMQDLSTADAYAMAELGHDVTDTIASFPAPTIAAVDGYAFGGGCELAMACDLRVASESALLGNTELDLGIIPGWGGTQRLPQLVGDETARRMIFLGDRLDAETAAEEGLVGEVVPDGELHDRVMELATNLAAQPSFALATAKRAIDLAQEGSRTAGLEYERRAFASLFGTHDQQEGMQAFLESRPPEFD